MVSHAELIYQFTDIYLKSALECSICKENYMMADDNKFLDDFMKFFSTLLLVINDDPDIELDQIKDAMYEKREETFRQFDLFMKRQITQQAIEYAERKIQNTRLPEEKVNSEYLDTIKKYLDYVFDSESEQYKTRPVCLLKKIREKEEDFKKNMES